MLIKINKAKCSRFAVRSSSCQWPVGTFSGARSRGLNGNSTDPQDSPKKPSQTWHRGLWCRCRAGFVDCGYWGWKRGAFFFFQIPGAGGIFASWTSDPSSVDCQNTFKAWGGHHIPAAFAVDSLEPITSWDFQKKCDGHFFFPPLEISLLSPVPFPLFFYSLFPFRTSN